MIDVIKEYLISVGIGVDNKSFNDAKGQMNKVENMLGKSASSIYGRFAIATAGITALYATLTVTMAKFSNSVAQTDRHVELLARRFFTTEANARSLSTAMKAMGISSMDQLKDVALNPEMRGQFLELRRLARSLESPESQAYLKYIREINFEFQKIAIRAEYLKIRLASAFAEGLKPSIDAFKKDFKPLYDNIIKNLPKYTEKIGKSLANIAQIGMHVGQAFGNIINFIVNLPDHIKKIGQASTILFLALRTNLGAIFLVLQSIFLMIDDYMVYLKGGKSYYGDVYDILSGKGKKVTEDNENFIDRTVKNYKKGGGGMSGTIYAAKEMWNQKSPGGKMIQQNRGTDYGNIRIRDDQYVMMSSPLLDFVKELNPYLKGAAKSDYVISDGYTMRGSVDKGHASGLKMDIGFAGKTFQEQMKLLQALSQQSKLAHAFIEVSSKEEYQRYINALNAGGYDSSKFEYSPTRKGNEHVDVRAETPKNLTFYIYESGNPKETAREIVAELDREGIRDNQEVIV